MDKKELVYKLKTPFAFEDHEARKGSSGAYYIYVKKEAIIDRLDELFPLEWGTRVVSIERIENRVEVSMEMQIAEITRSYNGVSEDNYNSKTKKTYPKDTQKAAVTDAFKRVATMFGVGLYLQRCGAYHASSASDALVKFEKWYNSEYGSGNAPKKDFSTPGKRVGSNGDNQKQQQSEDDWHAKFVEWCKLEDVMGSDYSDTELMRALNLSLLVPTEFEEIKYIKKMPHDKQHAMCAVVAWITGYGKIPASDVLIGLNKFTDDNLRVVNDQIKNANINLDKEVNFNG